MAAVPATMLLSSLTLSRPSSIPLLKSPIARRPSYGGCSVSVECSSRPQKKCTAHHVKTRPKKHNPYDKNRKGPTKYPRPPKPPPIWGWDLSGEPEQEIAAVKSEESAPVSAPDL